MERISPYRTITRVNGKRIWRLIKMNMAMATIAIGRTKAPNPSNPNKRVAKSLPINPIVSVTKTLNARRMPSAIKIKHFTSLWIAEGAAYESGGVAREPGLDLGLEERLLFGLFGMIEHLQIRFCQKYSINEEA